MTQATTNKNSNPLTQTHARFRLPNLPAIKSNAFRLSNGQVGYTGSILQRPVKNSLGTLTHYGMFYGVGHDGTIWILENNVDGVVCITLVEFLQGSPIRFSYVNPYSFTSDSIMTRAMERIDIPYDARRNNCETFIMYCVFAKLESRQSKNTENLVDILISGLELYVTLDPNNYGLANIFSGIRTKLELPRMLEMNKALEHIQDVNGKQNLNDFMRLLEARQDVTSKMRKQWTTFYYKRNRFAIADTQTVELFLKLKDYENPEFAFLKRALEYPVPALKGKHWIVIRLAHANRNSCLKLIEESYTAARLGQQTVKPNHLKQ